MCRPPKNWDFRRFRLEPSPTYPHRCSGCGYHFHSKANLRDHWRAWGMDIEEMEKQA